MDWRTIPSFMPQGLPSMQQPAYSAPPHSGGWTSTAHTGSLAFQQPHVTLPSQSSGYSNGFGGGQQFKKSMVPSMQFGRPLHATYGQGPMPVSHRKPGEEVDGMHSMVAVKSEASDIIEVWETKGRNFPTASHGSWLQSPGRVTIKSEPVEVAEGNPWDTAKSVPAFPSNLPAPDTSGWHPVPEVPNQMSAAAAQSHQGHYGLSYQQDANRGSCSKKEPSLNLPYPGASMGMNHAALLPPPNSVKTSMPQGMPMASSPQDHQGAEAQAKMKGPVAVKCDPLEPEAPAPKKKKEKKGPPIPCKQCGKEFSKSYMKKHIRSHAEMKPYVCSSCGKVFYSAPLLAEHEAAFHDEEKKHQCYVCGHRFHQKSLLKEHLKTHVEKPYKCRVCPRSFSRRLKLNNHEKLHEGAQLKQCEVCGKLLKGRVSLKCHMHNMHSETRKKFPCLDCGRIFLLERSLTTHRYVVHTGERPFKCPDCGRAFADIKYLKSHLLIHTGEKPYQCNVCGKRFRQSTALWCHKTTHTGIKPHRCPDCGRQSVHRSELAKHKCAARRDPHQPTDSPPVSPDQSAPPQPVP